jgi:hypothetical protein
LALNPPSNQQLIFWRQAQGRWRHHEIQLVFNKLGFLLLSLRPQLGSFYRRDNILKLDI